MSATVAPPAAARSTSASRADSGVAPRASAAAARSRSITRSPATTARMARASSATGEAFAREPAATPLHRPPEEARAAEGGEHDGPAAGQLGGQLTRRREAVHAGHLDVE